MLLRETAKLNVFPQNLIISQGWTVGNIAIQWKQNQLVLSTSYSVCRTYHVSLCKVPLKVSSRAGHRASWLDVRLIFPTWFDHQEEILKFRSNKFTWLWKQVALLRKLLIHLWVQSNQSQTKTKPCDWIWGFFFFWSRLGMYVFACFWLACCQLPLWWFGVPPLVFSRYFACFCSWPFDRLFTNVLSG